MLPALRWYSGPRAGLTSTSLPTTPWRAANRLALPRQVRAYALNQGTDRQAHNEYQAQQFNSPGVIEAIGRNLPKEIDERLAQIANAAPGLGPDSRVIDVGTGTGCLIPHLQRRGVSDILAIDVSPGMLAELRSRFPDPGTCGNDLGVRTWLGDIVDLPVYQGPVDAVLFNAVIGNVHNQHDTLTAATLLLRPGGSIVLSHPEGRQWHDQLRAKEPQLVPHALPGGAELAALTHDLPLEVTHLVDQQQLYLAVLQVPDHYKYRGAPLYMEGEVIAGFGRGSKQLGVPTANIPPEAVHVDGGVSRLPLGVYFGWAQVDPPPGAPPADSRVHRMVMNVGRRPTLDADGASLSVELHLLHSFSADFYGARMRAVALGFLRPELRFSGLPQLLARIRRDIAAASLALQGEEFAAYARDPLFRQQFE